MVGPEGFNHYGHALISNPLVIHAEFGLIGLLLLHIFKALQHFLLDWTARPNPYTKKVWAGGPRSNRSRSFVEARRRVSDERGWQHALTRVGEIDRRIEKTFIATFCDFALDASVVNTDAAFPFCQLQAVCATCAPPIFLWKS